MTEYNAKIQEIEDRLSAAEEELRALKAEKGEDDLPAPPHPRPMPNCSEICYHVDSTGTVLGGPWDNTTWDCKRRAIGNVFRTADAAEYAAECFKVLAEIREWTGNWDDPFAINMNADYILGVECLGYPDDSFGELRFATEGDALNCIKAVGEDRLKKYYFGVPEDDGCCTSEI